MRRTLALVLVLLMGVIGCRRGVGGPTPGADSSDAAVQQFLFAAKAQDLQAMSAVWGDAVSPVRDRADRQQVERRLLIMICHLRHDESRIGAAEAGERGSVVHSVALTQGAKQATTKFTAIRNTSTGRWFVMDFELNPLVPFCAGSGGPVRPPDARAH